jgi:hypothetical protein
MADRSIKKIIADNTAKHRADFSSDGKMLIDFLGLIVDIKYRHKYGTSIANPDHSNYSDGTVADSFQEELPDL